MAFLSDKEDRELLESIQNGNTQETVLSAPKSRLISRCILLVSVVLVVFQLYTAFFGSFQSLIQRPVHVFLGSMLIFLYQMQKNDRTTLFKKLDVGVCWVGILIALVGCVYIVKNMKAIMHPNFSISSFECVLAILILLLVLDCARRSIGMAIPIMAIIAIGYAMFGKYIPGTWGHNGITFRNLLTTLVYSDRGVWGSITGTSATIIATFVIFGSVLFSTGGGQTFIDAANALTGRATGGAAKLATISSALFGTVSGSAGANVATTGAFTIPMMKRLGYKKEFAAAVECSASSGGQIMPPVMGAGAFIMADLLGMPYLGIAAAAVLPAVMYYLGVFVAIDCAARRYHYKGLAEEDMVSLREVFYYKKSLPVFLPILLLIVFFISGYTAVTCASYALIAAIILFLAVEPKECKQRLHMLFDGFIASAKSMLTTLSLIACAQILVCLISVTGIGVKFSGLIMEIGGGHMFLAGLMAMIATMILGMGMPTVAAYVLAASVIAPALVRVGVVPVAAHFFVFYYAIFAGLTPPVCGTVFIGAAMAESNWLKTAWDAIRISIGAFVVPFMFLFSPALLLVGSTAEIIRCSVTCFVGMVALAGGGMGYLVRTLKMWERIILAAIGLLLIVPTVATDIIGVVGTVLAIIYLRASRKRTL
jgi:TRAP transporter, 4TM/12TM fusion protein